jgi:hypothetical protein
VLGGVVAAAWWRFNIPSGTQDVVVYVSHDEVVSEPILKDFEKETGIKVRAVYDTEETKSTGEVTRTANASVEERPRVPVFLQTFDRIRCPDRFPRLSWNPRR